MRSQRLWLQLGQPNRATCDPPRAARPVNIDESSHSSEQEVSRAEIVKIFATQPVKCCPTYTQCQLRLQLSRDVGASEAPKREMFFSNGVFEMHAALSPSPAHLQSFIGEVFGSSGRLVMVGQCKHAVKKTSSVFFFSVRTCVYESRFSTSPSLAKPAGTPSRVLLPSSGVPSLASTFKASKAL